MNFQIEMWDIDDVIPYENNVKVHDKKQVDKIARSIKEFGFDQPLVVDANGVLIKGHGRRLAAIELGLKKVPVLVRADLDEDQVKASRLADNRVAMGDIDTMLLQEELRKINMELEGIFDAKELEFLNADLLEINPDGVEQNLIESLENKTLETIDELAASMKETVKIADVLGFKTVLAEQERNIAMFLACVEEKYGLKGGDALYAFATDYLYSTEESVESEDKEG